MLGQELGVGLPEEAPNPGVLPVRVAQPHLGADALNVPVTRVVDLVDWKPDELRGARAAAEDERTMYGEKAALVDYPHRRGGRVTRE